MAGSMELINLGQGGRQTGTVTSTSELTCHLPSAVVTKAPPTIAYKLP
jgi:hypothetical protein